METIIINETEYIKQPLMERTLNPVALRIVIEQKQKYVSDTLSILAELLKKLKGVK